MHQTPSPPHIGPELRPASKSRLSGSSSGSFSASSSSCAAWACAGNSRGQHGRKSRLSRVFFQRRKQLLGLGERPIPATRHPDRRISQAACSRSSWSDAARADDVFAAVGAAPAAPPAGSRSHERSRRAQICRFERKALHAPARPERLDPARLAPNTRHEPDAHLRRVQRVHRCAGAQGGRNRTDRVSARLGE